jgi:Tfp pilus assembly protein PilF
MAYASIEAAKDEALQLLRKNISLNVPGARSAQGGKSAAPEEGGRGWRKVALAALALVALAGAAAFAMAQRNGGGLRVGGASHATARPSTIPAARRAAGAPAVMVAAAHGPAMGDSAGTSVVARRAEAYGRLVQGDLHMTRGSASDVFAAINEYTAATDLDSVSAKAYSRLGLAYATTLQRGWFQSAASAEQLLSRGMAATDDALLRDSSSVEAWVARGSLLEFRSARSLDEVFRSYARALKLAPDDTQALRLYARAAAYAGDFGLAEERYRRALGYAPNGGPILSELAELQFLRRRFGDAKRTLDEVMASDTRIPNAYLLRARMRLRSDQFRDAWSDAETAMRLGYRIPGAAAGALVYAQPARHRAGADSHRCLAPRSAGEWEGYSGARREVSRARVAGDRQAQCGAGRPGARLPPRRLIVAGIAGSRIRCDAVESPVPATPGSVPPRHVRLPVRSSQHADGCRR